MLDQLPNNPFPNNRFFFSAIVALVGAIAFFLICKYCASWSDSLFENW